MWKSKFRLTVSHQITCCVFLQKINERENWNVYGTYISVLDCINPTKNIKIICTNPYKMLVNGCLISYKKRVQGSGSVGTPQYWTSVPPHWLLQIFSQCNKFNNSVHKIYDLHHNMRSACILNDPVRFFLWMNYNLTTVFIIMLLVFLISS